MELWEWFVGVRRNDVPYVSVRECVHLGVDGYEQPWLCGGAEWSDGGIPSA